MPEVTIQKTGWTTVAFGDVVRQVKDRVDPEESGLERYVAGEHMDTDDLRIRRWGEIGVGYLGPAFHMRFKPGHVLYGSRRTYLRKVAVADFDGITANTTYVLEPKDSKVLLPELLPFIMRTNAFNQHSIRESRGSVNPYVNFSDLARYKFALPPIKNQRLMVGALQCSMAVADKLFLLGRSAQVAFAAAAAARFEPLLSSAPITTLEELCSKKPQSGIYKSEEYRGQGVPMVNMRELFGNDCIDASVAMERIDLDKSELQRYSLTENDLLFGRRSVVLEGAGQCVMVGTLDEPTVFESSVLRVTINDAVADSRFIFEWLRSPYGRQQVRRIVTFTTVSGVAGSDVARLPVPLPNLTTQQAISRELGALRQLVLPPVTRMKRSNELAVVLLERLMEAV